MENIVVVLLDVFSLQIKNVGVWVFFFQICKIGPSLISI